MTTSTATPRKTRGPGPKNFHGRILTPRIGEAWEGQAGVLAGIIKGEGDQPDYCLVAPADRSGIIKGQWGPQIEVKGALGEFDGMANTWAMAQAGSDIAKRALELAIDGHHDFYIASRREARVVQANISDRYESAWRWTSTEDAGHAFYAWGQDFGCGDQLYWHKDGEFPALLVRRVPIR